MSHPEIVPFDKRGEARTRRWTVRMSGPNARSAPKGWEAVVADLAETHADELESRVAQLRELVTRLRADLGD
jgi:uncharacterized protein YceH (UPF0502 family)